jgi:hypothetical protein
MQQLFAAVAGSRAAMDAFVCVSAGTLSPTEFFDPAYLASILAPPEGAAALHKERYQRRQ